jgi:hypothetical protein
MGPGWGGDAKGESTSRFLPGEHAAMIRSLAFDPKNQEAKARARELYLGTLVEVMTTSEVDAARVSAADKFADRIDGKAAQKIDVDAKVASHVIRAPAAPESVAEWAATYAPRGNDE